MLLDEATFKKIEAMFPQYRHVTYQGADQHGTWFKLSNQNEQDETTEAERVRLDDNFDVTGFGEQFYVKFENGKKTSGYYPKAVKLRHSIRAK